MAEPARPSPALFIGDDDVFMTDRHGVTWMTGWAKGTRYKRKLGVMLHR
jgi:hypothetical protein